VSPGDHAGDFATKDVTSRQRAHQCTHGKLSRSTNVLLLGFLWVTSSGVERFLALAARDRRDLLESGRERVIYLAANLGW
jgi:hypothetical protein